CLDKEVEVYNDMLEIVNKKQELLIKNKWFEIEKLTKELVLLTEKAKDLNLHRLKILKNMGFEGKNLSWFEEYIGKAKGFESISKRLIEQITAKSKKIKKSVFEITEANKSNIFLIKQGRKGIKAYFDLIFKQLNNTTYCGLGTIKNKEYKKNILIDKVL
ncbi:MAG: flagellar export chaperone FlgN, partial [Actinomycetota bacterium]|nr:flagellar export chaperone FlgN [Actinomycetota bacterium]